MIYVQNASPVNEYKIKILFNDKKEGIADLSEIVEQGVFKKIKNPQKFQNFNIDSTLTWEKGELDIAPEFLYFQAFKKEKGLQKQFKEWGYI